MRTQDGNIRWSLYYLPNAMEHVMGTMKVNLTEEMAAFVEGEVAAGDYASASEVVREALDMLRREKEVESAKMDALRREIDAGLTQAERGEFSDRGVTEIADEVLRERGR
jgi:antitoxin ParD1/3/4